MTELLCRPRAGWETSHTFRCVKRKQRKRLFLSFMLVAILLWTGCVEADTNSGSSRSSHDGDGDNGAAPSSASASSAQECVVVDDEGQCENEESQKEHEGLSETVANAASKSATSPGTDDDDDDGEEYDVWTMGAPWEIAEVLNCPSDDPYGYKEIHTEETWRTFNRIYNEIVGPEHSSIPPAFETSGFQIAIEIKFRPGIGRGVFAGEPIPRGTLVYECINTGQFRRAQDYRDFLKRLPPKLACDVIIWAYSRMISRELKDSFMVCVDLDEGSFVNSGTYHQSNTELGVGGLLGEDAEEDATWYGCNMQFYANRDIAAGEEIRTAYADFAEPHGWRIMGL